MMRRLLTMLGSLGLTLALGSVTLGADHATMEGIATKYTAPQEVYVVYGVGALPVGPVLVKEVTQALCLSVEMDARTAQGGGRQPADPLTFPVKVVVSQWTKSGTGFAAERRAEVVVKRCVQKGERDA